MNVVLEVSWRGSVMEDRNYFIFLGLGEIGNIS
jgi:hypothetical protein